MKIESILESGEHVVECFSGSLNEEMTRRKGTWFITNRRLIYLPSPEVKTDLKKTIIGGALFGGIGGTLGTKVDMPESFETYRLDNLISIDVEQGNTLKAVFQIAGLDDTQTILLETEWPSDFKSEVENAAKCREEEKARRESALAEMMDDEKIRKLSSEIAVLEEELKEIESKGKYLDLAYGMGRISKEVQLEKMREGNISQEIERKKFMLDEKRKELGKRKEKYL